MTTDEIVNALSILPNNKGIKVFAGEDERPLISPTYGTLKQKGFVYIKDTEDSRVIAAGLTIAGVDFPRINKR
jgi:hypothetical protein